VNSNHLFKSSREKNIMHSMNIVSVHHDITVMHSNVQIIFYESLSHSHSLQQAFLYQID
jgi:hypothetical protein